jgi:hypothetical protein
VSIPLNLPPFVQSNPRNPVCQMFDLVLCCIVELQDTGNTDVAEAMRLEFGESVTASIMQAAGIKRLRMKYEQENDGTQDPMGAPSQ